jgi:hypothetical protein
MKINNMSSKLKDHYYDKKKRVLITPFNQAMGESLVLSSWAKERMPEYLWLGLILHKYGRKIGIEKAGNILLEISNNIESLEYPKISSILNLSTIEQRKTLKIIGKYIDKEVLAPLNFLITDYQDSVFNDFFYDYQLNIREKINIITKAIETYSPHQSNEATDLRFLSVCIILFKKKVFLSKDVTGIISALTEYPYMDHENEKMKMYRSMIRAFEGGLRFNEIQSDFPSKFWRDIGMLTSCEPMKINFKKRNNDYKQIITDFRKALEYVLCKYKEKSLGEEKFQVLTSSFNYVLKLYEEIIIKNLGNSILGRHALRTMIEVYIMIKYLIKNESQNPKIWGEYKKYGVSKYKLVLTKSREGDFLDETSHIVPPIVEIIVNEIMSEEYIDIDLKYFDDIKIREKFIEVGEKDLYDYFYDYDSNFSHGLWGAIRESSTVFCNNVNHQNHSIPDININQKLSDARPDAERVLKMNFQLFATIYELPAWINEKYGKK